MAAPHVLPGIGHIIMLLVASGGGCSGFPRERDGRVPCQPIVQSSQTHTHTFKHRIPVDTVGVLGDRPV